MKAAFELIYHQGAKQVRGVCVLDLGSPNCRDISLNQSFMCFANIGA